MISIRTSTKINKPIDTVSKYIFDLKNSKNWYKNIKYANILPAKNIGYGTTIFIGKNWLGTEFLRPYKVLEYEKGRKLKIKGGYLLNFETTFFLENTRDNQTRITMRNKSKSYLIFAPINPITKLIVHLSSRKDLSNLKTILERS